MADQHDDHCRLISHGLPWRITAVRGPIIELECPNGCHATTLDTTDADFAGYCDAAVMRLKAAAASKGSGVPLHPGSRVMN